MRCFTVIFQNFKVWLLSPVSGRNPVVLHKNTDGSRTVDRVERSSSS